MLLQSQFGVFTKATVLCLLEELKDDFFADARPHKIIFLRLHLNTFYHPRTSLSAVLSWKLSTEIFSVRLTSLKVNKKNLRKVFLLSKQIFLCWNAFNWNSLELFIIIIIFLPIPHAQPRKRILFLSLTVLRIAARCLASKKRNLDKGQSMWLLWGI